MPLGTDVPDLGLRERKGKQTKAEGIKDDTAIEEMSCLTFTIDVRDVSTLIHSFSFVPKCVNYYLSSTEVTRV